MADYNIYIHNDQTSDAHPTQPISDENSKSETKAFGVVNEGINFLNNPDSLMAKGIGAVAKAIPEIAVAYAATKLTLNTINTIESFKSIATGDYRFQTDYNNFQTMVNAHLRPFSTIVNAERFRLQQNVNNQRMSQYRELTGDAIINSYGKGV